MSLSMAKTAAEKQRDYRARKKAQGVDFAKVQRDWRAGHKANVRAHNQKQKANKSKYSKTQKGKATFSRYHKKRMSDAGKRVVLSIGSRITQSMNHASGKSSNRLVMHTEFKNSSDVREHFQSLWKPWMNWSNYGPHVIGVRNWNVGHRIPIAFYDHDDIEDVRRCWAKDNLFPQEAKENAEMNDSFPGWGTVLGMEHVWPKEWLV